MAELGPVASQSASRKVDSAYPWIARFVASHGRKPRVLHIGNIANNAYINCKLLNEAGVECDLICYDYYHLMGCPEWEEADLEAAPEDQAHPDWTRVDLRGYRRPKWFAQGPLTECLSYLLSRRQGRRVEAARHWQRLGVLNRTRTASPQAVDWILDGLLACSRAPRLSALILERSRLLAARAVRYLLRSVRSITRRWERVAARVFRSFVILQNHVLPAAESAHWSPARVARQAWWTIREKARSAPLARWLGSLDERAERSIRDAAASLSADAERELDVVRTCERFLSLFPTRVDKLQSADLAPYLQVVPQWSRLFDQYDLIQAYATDPILPALTGHGAVAFEHGTLRTFLWDETPLHRLTALGYRHAGHVFVTNGDCLAHAEKLGVEDYSAMLHPVDVEQHRSAGQELTAEIRARYAADCLLLCPLRHDWTIKGTDVHLRALPLIKALFPGRLVVFMTEWGADLDASKALVLESGCAENVRWIAPLGRIHLIAHMRAAHCVLDQIALPHFGATAPQALAVGTPVISSYDPRSTDWIVAEPAPILPAFTPEQVADAVLLALDPDWRADFANRARNWIDRHHHHRRVVADHLRIYEKLINRKEVTVCH